MRKRLWGRVADKPIVHFEKNSCRAPDWRLYSVPAQGSYTIGCEPDVFLFPSLMEGLPGVLLEAMAAGISVITTETCDMPDIVEHEFNGLLIPPANAAAIEESILRLARSVELRQRLGEAARLTMKRYTWERAARQLEPLYRRVLALDKTPVASDE